MMASLTIALLSMIKNDSPVNSSSDCVCVGGGGGEAAIFLDNLCV